MYAKELSIHIGGNQPEMVRACDLLGKENINIRAFTKTDGESGEDALRIVVDNPVKAMLALKSNGFKVGEGEIIAVEAPDHPGALAAILKILGADCVNVRYLYAAVEKMGENAVIIVSVDDMDKAVESLQRNWFKVHSAEEVYSL